MNDLPTLTTVLPDPDATSLAILLDVDGTLLEFAPTPAGVDVPGTLRDTLAALLVATDGALALISGRSLHNLDDLFRPLVLPAAGLHGLEMRDAPTHVLGHAEVAAFEREKARLVDDLRADPRLLIEDKGPCFAVHYRRAPERGDDVIDAMTAARERLGGRFHILAGNRVVELKPADIGKGDAVAKFMKVPPFAGRRPVYIGDDVTDEDAFITVNELGGVSVCVGTRRPTAAMAGLRDVSAVREWLSALAETGRARNEKSRISG